MANLFPDPSAEQDSAVWGDWNGPFSHARSNEQAKYGIYSRKCVTDSVGDGLCLTVAGRVTGLTPLATYTLSAYIYGSGVWECFIEEYNAGGGIVDYSGFSVTATPTTDWSTRLVQPCTLHATSVGARCVFRTHSSSGAAATAYFDGFQLVAGGSAEEFVDPDAPTDNPYARIRPQFELRPH